MADNPRTAAIESSNACRERLFEATRSVSVADELRLVKASGNVNELCSLGFPDFDVTDKSSGSDSKPAAVHN